MNRVDQTKDTIEQLGVRQDALATPFSEFTAVKDRFIYGDVWTEGDMSTRLRLLVSIASLTTVEGEDLAEVLRVALGQDVTPAELQEVFHQIAPYVGFPRAEKGLAVFAQVLGTEGIALPLEPQGVVTEDDRLELGVSAQKSLFGPAIDAMRANAPEDEKFMQDYLSAYCFGDTYTRGALDLQTRELLTFVCIISLGGCDPQAKAHVAGNLAIGNSKPTLLNAVSQCVPYIGFPRSLNAISAINEVTAPREQQA